MRIVFLGTSSATPTLHRHLSCVALQREGEVLLFDCGEGAQMQLQRVTLRPSRISTIALSHLHGDHVTGLPGLLMTMKLLGRTEPLDVFGPEGTADFVYGFIRLLRLRPGFRLVVKELSGHEEVRREGYVLRAIPLNHGVPAIGYALIEDERPGRFDVERARALGLPPGPDWGRLQRGEPVTTPEGRLVQPGEVLGPPRRGRRVVYATDTAPCEAVVEAARGADVLIHEATFAGGEEALARERKHSTSLQAAEIGRRAGVHKLILTHISARYGSVRPLLRGVRAIHPETIVSRDLMEVEVPLPD